MADRAQLLVLRQVRAPISAWSPVVARCRGAVLPGVAMACPARPVPGAGPAGQFARLLARCGSHGARRGFGRGDGSAVPPRIRSDAGLRRHRRPGVRAADRGGAGIRAAEPDDAGGPEAAGPAHPGRRRRGGPARDRGPDLAHQPVLTVFVSRRHGRAFGGDCGGCAGRRLACEPAWPDPGLGPPAVARSALLWHLPVALPDHRADDPRQMARTA